MFALMEDAYDNLSRARFESDLNAKQWAILLSRRDTGELVGFSTQTTLNCQIGQTSVQALYSGDTVVRRDHWGDFALAHAWGNLARQLIAEQKANYLYWFLTSKGYRTYHYLPLFFQQFYPCCLVPTPPWESQVIVALAQQIAPNAFDRSTGIIRADSH